MRKKKDDLRTFVKNSFSTYKEKPPIDAWENLTVRLYENQQSVGVKKWYNTKRLLWVALGVLLLILIFQQVYYNQTIFQLEKELQEQDKSSNPTSIWPE